MSTQDLVYNLPKLRSRSLQRKFSMARHKAGKTLKTKIRHTKRQIIATYRRQYFLTNAGRDFRMAASKNEDIFITSLIIAAVIGYSFAVTATDLLLLFFQTALEGTSKLGLGMLPLSIAALGTLSVLGIWVLAFMLNAISIALMEGATGKRYRSVRATLRNALRHAGRVSTVWVLIALRLAVPILLVAVGSLLSIAAAGVNDLEQALQYVPYAGGFAALGALYVLVRCSLAPYVMLFEQPNSYHTAFRRSRQLVRRRGRIFLCATYLSIAASAAGLYGFAVLLENILGINKLVPCMLGGLAITVLLNGTLVVLYRKRKLARKH